MKITLLLITSFLFVSSSQAHPSAGDSYSLAYQSSDSLFDRSRGGIYYDYMSDQCKVYSGSFSGSGNTRRSSTIARANCNPFFIGQVVKETLGSCSSKKVTTAKVGRGFSKSSLKVKLTEDCVCYKQVGGRDGMFSGGKRRKGADYNECLPFFKRSQLAQVLEIINDLSIYKNPRSLYLNPETPEDELVISVKGF